MALGDGQANRERLTVPGPGIRFRRNECMNQKMCESPMARILLYLEEPDKAGDNWLAASDLAASLLNLRDSHVLRRAAQLPEEIG